MNSISHFRREYEFSKYLKVTVESRSVRRIYVSRDEQPVGEISVRIDYSCDKLFHTCFEEGEITYDISSTGGLKLNSEIAELTYDVNGKLRGEVKGGKTITLDVGRGRGQGYLSYKYALKAKSSEAGKYVVTVTLFYTSRKGEKKRLIEPITLELEVVKPLKVDQISISPLRSYYVLGDPVKIILRISSEYEGIVEIRCKGVIKDLQFRRKIEKGIIEIPIDTVIGRPGNKVEVVVRTLSIMYEESIVRSLRVREQRVLIKGVSVERAEIGKEAYLTITLTNLSSVSETAVLIKATLYGFELEVTHELKPEETRQVGLKTPILTKESVKHLRGKIEVHVLQLKLVESKQVELPEPKALAVKVEALSSELKIPSSTLGELQLRVKNDSDLNIAIMLSNTSSTLCRVAQGEEIKVMANSFEVFSVRFKPVGLGSERAVLTFAAVVSGVVVEEYSVALNVKVYRSFSVKGYEVLYPNEASYLVKGQRIDLQLKIEVFYDAVSLTIKSPDLEIESPRQTVYKPWFNVLISGRALNYADGVRIIVSDGLVKEELRLPIKISKPFLKHEIITSRLFTGVRKPIGLVFKNPFDASLKATLEIEVLGPAELSSNRFEIRVAPHEEEKVEVGVTGLREGSAELRLTARYDYIGEESGKVEDSSTQEYSIKFEIYRPIQVRIAKPSNTLQLPYPVKGKLKNLRTPFRIYAFLRNVSDVTLPGVTVESRPSAGRIEVSVNPKTLLLRHGREERVSIGLHVPANYLPDILTISLDVMVSKYKVASSEVQVGIKRVVHTTAYILRHRFVEEECRYPYIAVESGVYVLVPITEGNIDVCGEPQEPYVRRHKILRDLYSYIEKRLAANTAYDDPWIIAASILFKNTTQARPDYSAELRSLEGIKYLEGNMILVPALLWRAAIAYLVGKGGATGSVREFLGKEQGLGLVYIKDVALYKARNPLYEGLLKLLIAEDRNAVRDLHTHVLRNVKEGRIDPLFLLYKLYELSTNNRGPKLVFSEDIADELYGNGRFRDYLLYLALTDASLTEEGLLKKISEILRKGTIEGRSPLLALSIILRKLIDKDLNELIEVS